jgi:catechol 2,3-dioxygenase-like lactoylglutathione lyase family enzyme
MTMPPAGGPDAATLTNPLLSGIALYTNDLPTSRKFYESIGFDFILQQHDSGPEHLAAELANGGVLELYPPNKNHPDGHIRLDFAIPTNADLPRTTRPATLDDPAGRTVAITPTTPTPRGHPARIPPTT